MIGFDLATTVTVAIKELGCSIVDNPEGSVENGNRSIVDQLLKKGGNNEIYLSQRIRVGRRTPKNS